MMRRDAQLLAAEIARAIADPAQYERALPHVTAPEHVGSWAEGGNASPRRRWQDQVIEDEIPVGASVLDLGCGDGALLARLVAHKHIRGQGVELDPLAVERCIAAGVPVVQANLDEGIKGFGEGSFDYAILEETVQTLHRPLEVLAGMLRVARHALVSFPNFGFWRVRLDLALRGRMPITGRLPFGWHDTPNIHLLTLQDFLDWTADAGVTVVKGFALSCDGVQPLRADDQLFAEEALLVLSR